jgi:hypothetical protein
MQGESASLQNAIVADSAGPPFAGAWPHHAIVILDQSFVFSGVFFKQNRASLLTSDVRHPG